MAKREVSYSEFNEWHEKYNQTLNNIHLGKLEKQQQLDEVFLQLEEGLTYVGCSAIEDKLQDGVADTIESLRQAGINIWMLTGDKIVIQINKGKFN